MSEAVYRLSGLAKSRARGGAAFRLWVSELEISRGDRVAVIGPSGCGKSTLLDTLSMVLRPDEVKTFMLTPSRHTPIDIAALWRQQALDTLAAVRGHHLGYVLQTGGLLGFLTVRQNISAPRRLLEMRDDGTIERLAARLGLAHYLDKHPGELSVGERQRVAVARALAHAPSIIITDEPTASLDPVTAETVMTLLMSLVEERGVTAIVATHDWQAVERFGMRRIILSTGRDPSGKGVLATVKGDGH
jgi:putative ABC transport system ATP-binding protein